MLKLHFQIKEKIPAKKYLGKSVISFISRYQPKTAYFLGKDKGKEEFFYKKTKIIKKGFWEK